jgi:hypothetical protein
VCVFKPRSDDSEANNSEKSVLSIEELEDLDGLEFEGLAVTNAPGVLLHKGNSSAWTPIATRTRSRLKLPSK